MRLLFILLFQLLGYYTIAQTTLKGTVVDALTNKPVAGTSVFIPNSSIGAIANAEGYFTLTIPSGKYDIVFTVIGFETRLINSASVDAFTVVKLTPKAKELDEVVIRSYDKNGWANWGKFFLESFIGTTDNAEECFIKNTGVLRFSHDKKNNELIVIATEPLQITNKALGFNITYQLEHYSYNFKTKMLFYHGYPLFKAMDGNNRKQKRWAENRKLAYEGSQLHFMRALYRNQLSEEGFAVRRLKKVKNTEKQRIRNIVKKSGMGDSSAYYSNVLQQADEFDVLNSRIITGDSIAYAIDSVTAGIQFNDYLDITYTKKKTPAKYLQLYPHKPSEMISQITLLDTLQEISIQADGSFFPPHNLLNLGYWAWSENISTMLPFNYKP